MSREEKTHRPQVENPLPHVRMERAGRSTWNMNARVPALFIVNALAWTCIATHTVACIQISILLVVS